jgi:hypothetical protein
MCAGFVLGDVDVAATTKTVLFGLHRSAECT